MTYRSRKPLISSLRGLIVRPVASAFARGIDDTGNMSAASQNKAHFAVSKLCDTPGRFPGDDMVLLSSNSIDILVDLTKVNGDTLEDDLVRLDEIVFQIGIAQVERMGSTSHARAISVPIKQVEGWWLFA